MFITASDVDTWTTEASNRRYVNLAERTGMIPEGPLQLCARLLTLTGVQLTQTCGDAAISLPEPPQLILPANASQVTEVQPVFQWTPIVVPPDLGLTYHVKIVPVGPQQSPGTAMQ